jgi:hypothetical protein
MSNVDDLEEALSTYCCGEILRRRTLTPTFRDLAEEWDSEGFGVIDAHEWWNVGCYVAVAAGDLVRAGINPDEVQWPLGIAACPGCPSVAYAYANGLVRLDEVIAFAEDGRRS